MVGTCTIPIAPQYLTGVASVARGRTQVVQEGACLIVSPNSAQIGLEAVNPKHGAGQRHAAAERVTVVLNRAVFTIYYVASECKVGFML
jgi:hypothetical protein